MHQLKKVLNVNKWAKQLLIAHMLMSLLFAVENNMTEDSSDWLSRLSQNPVELPSQITSVNDLITSVITNNSQLRSQFAQWQFANKNIHTVANLPDPIFSAGYFAEPVQTAQGPQIGKLSISQSLPFLTKTRAVRGGMQAASDETFEALQDTRLQLIKKLRSLWVQAGYLNESYALIKRKIDLSRDLETVLTTQYSSGAISYQLYASAQIRTLELLERGQSLLDQHHRVMIALGVLLELGHPFSESSFPDQMSSGLPGYEQRHIPMTHPRIGQMDDMLAKSNAQRNVAKANFLPDVKIGLDYIITDKRQVSGLEQTDSGRDPIIVSVGLALPVWNWKAKRASLKASQHQIEQTTARRQHEIQLLQKQLQLSQSRLREHNRNIGLLRDELIPRAEEIVKVSEQAYITQSIEIQILTAHEQNLLDLKLNLAKTKLAVEAEKIELAYLLGD